MNQPILIKNSTIVNDGKSFVADVLLSDGLIRKIGNIDSEPNHKVIDATGNHLVTGIIDGQVHFKDT